MIDYLEVARTSLANEAAKQLPKLAVKDSGPGEWNALHPPSPLYNVHFTDENAPKVTKHLGFCTVTFKVRVDYTQSGDVEGARWELVKVAIGNEDGAEAWVQEQINKQPKRGKRNATVEVVDA